MLSVCRRSPELRSGVRLFPSWHGAPRMHSREVSEGTGPCRDASPCSVWVMSIPGRSYAICLMQV